MGPAGIAKVVTPTAPCEVPGVARAYHDCVIQDDFLDRELHRALLAHALEQGGAVSPAEVYRGPEPLVDRSFRQADFCDAGLGLLREPFMDRVMSRFDDMIEKLGIDLFAIGFTEVELVAHKQDARFAMHIDTMTQDALAARDSVRILSLVYYFSRQPQGFTGGELELVPVGGREPLMIAPVDNRLVAFPSDTPHQVHRVACPSGEFAASRFAVNVWLSRSRAPAAGAPG